MCRQVMMDEGTVPFYVALAKACLQMASRDEAVHVESCFIASVLCVNVQTGQQSLQQLLFFLLQG